MELAFALLLVALALFWLSTRQFQLAVRGLIWTAAAALLAWSALIGTSQDFGLLSAILDAWLHRNDPDEAAIIRALSLNAETVAPFFQQLQDFFVFATGLLGVFSLLAFGKGERLERFLRASILALLGFVAGSIATLAVVAIGFGGYARPRTFTSAGQQVRVHDGDTFWIGDQSLRLFGIDAPEETQTCHGLIDGNCGATSKQHLEALLSRGTLQCDQMLSRASRRPKDTFGRALVRCWLTDGVSGSREDLAEILVRTGFAVQYEGDDYGYEETEIAARASGVGLLQGCWLRPDIFRSRRPEHYAARAAFTDRLPLDQSIPMIGNCANNQARPQE